MHKFLRIFFTILSALCVAAVLPVGAFLGFTWAIILAAGAFLFYLLMLTFKQAQIAQESQTKTAELPSQSERNEETDQETSELTKD